jgi:hypothetical protein
MTGLEAQPLVAHPGDTGGGVKEDWRYRLMWAAGIYGKAAKAHISLWDAQAGTMWACGVGGPVGLWRIAAHLHP